MFALSVPGALGSVSFPFVICQIAGRLLATPCSGASKGHSPAPLDNTVAADYYA